MIGYYIIIIPQVRMLQFVWLMRYSAFYGTAQDTTCLHGKYHFSARQWLPLLFYKRQQTSFDRTVKTIHRTMKILIYSDSLRKTTSITYIEVLSSWILNYNLIIYPPPTSALVMLECKQNRNTVSHCCFLLDRSVKTIHPTT